MRLMRFNPSVQIRMFSAINKLLNSVKSNNPIPVSTNVLKSLGTESQPISDPAKKKLILDDVLQKLKLNSGAMKAPLKMTLDPVPKPAATKSTFSFDGKIDFGNKSPLSTGDRPLGKSIRDSFRKIEEKTVKQQAVQAARDPYASSLFNRRTSSHAQAIAKDVMRGAENAKDGSGKGIEDVDAPDREEVAKDLRFERYKENMRIKREVFQASLPVDTRPKPAYRRGDELLPDEEAERKARLDDELRRGKTPTDTLKIDVADMKKQMAAKIAAMKDQNDKYAKDTKKEKKREKQLFAMSAAGEDGELDEKGRCLTDEEKAAAKLEKVERLRAKLRKTRKAGRALKSANIPEEGIYFKEFAQMLGINMKNLTQLLKSYGEEITITEEQVTRREKTRMEEDFEDKLIDADIAELVCIDMGLKVKRIAATVHLDEAKPSVSAVGTEVAEGVEQNTNKEVTKIDIRPRAPVVCVMGHVDHGKTTLLDALRNIKEGNKVAGAEAGGITQKLSAFSVTVSGDKQVVFLDTPGHAAFSAMRVNGALATDLVVLVVAIDDGVRPQTVEAIKAALDAKCTIVVALNKIDKITSTDERRTARTRVLTQLMEYGVTAEEFGGDVQVAEVSGRTSEGVDALIDSLTLQSDVMELTAAFNGQAEAVVLEAKMEKGKGVVADILVKWGSLNIGDDIVVGSSYGRVKAMYNDQGEVVETAYPSTSVRLLGLRTVPSNGQEMLSVDSEEKARTIADRRQRAHDDKRDAAIQAEMERRAAEAAAKLAAAKVPELDAAGKPVEVVPVVKIPTVNVIIKADGVGTVEALSMIVKGLASRTSEVNVNVIHAAVGDVTTTDIDLAHVAGDSLVLGFNVKMAGSDTRVASKEQDVSVALDDVIYRLEETAHKKMESLMPTERILHSEGKAKVLQIFSLNDKKKTVVAGLSVTAGKLRNTGSKYVYRVTRNGEEILADYGGDMELKRFKDVVKEVDSGHECGLHLGRHKDFQAGDDIECLRVEVKQKALVLASGVSGQIKSQNKTYDSIQKNY